jgi:putative aldouronate transport system substrate-binding protein
MKKVLILTSALLFTAISVFGGGSNQAGAAGGKVTLTAPGTTPIVNEKVTLSMFIQEHGDKQLVGNSVFAELEKETNIHLDLQITPAEGSFEKLNLILNSGQYPEIINIIDSFNIPDSYRYGAQEKIFIPINNLIETQGTNIKEYFRKYPWVKEAVTAPDGNIYGLPIVRAGADVVDHDSILYKMWINTTWLQNVGLPMPTTPEEFKNVLKAFKTQDPNKNGKADEWPLVGASSSNGGWNTDVYLYLLNAYGYYDEYNGSYVMLRGNTLVPTANQDYIRQGLTFIKSLYDEGFIYPPSLTLDDDVLQQEIPNTGVPPIYGCMTAPWPLWGGTDTELSRQYTTLEPLKGPTGYRGLPWPGSKRRPDRISYIITDKCKYPEVAFRLADAVQTKYWDARMMYGPKGTFWTDPDPGLTDRYGNPAGLKEILVSNKPARRNDSLGNGWEVMRDAAWGGAQVGSDIYDPNNFIAYMQYNCMRLVPTAVEMYIPNLPFTTDAASRLAQLMPGINDHIKSSIAEFISGKRSLNDVGWNQYKQELEQLGYSETVKIRQTAYDALKK